MKNPEKQSAARRVAEVRRQGLEAALNAYGEIVAALVAQAKKGSCPHAKLVFELIDRKRTQAAEEDEEDGPTLADYLLEQLKIVGASDGADTTGTPTV